MRFLTSFVEAQLHREVYAALLESLLRAPGSKRELARRAGISAPYLSYILRLDRDSPGSTVPRTPSPEVARRIAGSLDAPPEVRASLVEHMTLAHERRALAAQTASREIVGQPLDEVAREIGAIREQAVYASAALANSFYRAAVNASKLALQHAPPGAGPLDYAELCSVVSDCQCVLNRADDALWHAKLACAILDGYEPSPYDRDRYDYAVVNTLRQQGVAYHNLGQQREALRLYAQAEGSDPMRRRNGAWKGLLRRDRIKALARLPRFSITEVENIADSLRRCLEEKADADSPLGLWLLTEALAGAYIRHGNYKDARRALEEEYARAAEIPAIGPLHRVLFLRTYATLSRLTHDTPGWRHFIREAHQISLAAGLSHQLAEIEAEMYESREAWGGSTAAEMESNVLK